MLVLFVKRGELVEAEAAALVAGRHPGVVELVDVSDGALRTTRLEGARSLAEIGPLMPDEIAGVLASVAGTLADLHERGVVHGGLEASHVLVCADGRTVLCSLGRGGEPADDVAALGQLVGDLLATAPPDRPAGANGARGSRAGTRSFRGAARLGPMLAPAAAPVLARIASEAALPDPDARPSARSLAAAIHQRVPTARLPVPRRRPLLPLAAPSGKARRRPGRTRQRAGGPVQAAGRRSFHLVGVVASVVAASLVLVIAVVAISHLLADRGSGSRPPARSPAFRAGAQPLDAAGPIDPAPSAPIAVRVWPSEPLHFRDGVLTVDGTRYALGLPGDAVVAGDWGCTGRRTLALLRPATGEVFVFDGWPDAGQETTARPVGHIDGATGVRALDADGDGCDDLEVTRPGAPPVHLEPAA